MRTLLKNGMVINVFTGEIDKTNVLIEDETIIGVGNYDDSDADTIRDIQGKYICPGFIDGHIHIESTMLLPSELARVCVPHGTTTIVADPHEIANVCGTKGIKFMLEASENIPLSVYVMLPSCVPATEFDESGAKLNADDLEPFYSHQRVLGLAEMMNYTGVLAKDSQIIKKIAAARERKLPINGHAPLLSGKNLDTYIAAGICDDHECSSFEEAKERIRKGQRVMIRQGTAARNLEALLPLFDEPWSHRCLLVTDDKHPADLLAHGHIDDIIRQAVSAGKSPVTGIRMATLWAAECFGLKNLGAVAPGYKADILVLNNLDTVAVSDVYRSGVLVCENGHMDAIKAPSVRQELWDCVRNSVHMPKVTAYDFHIDANGTKLSKVISLTGGELITKSMETEIDFDRSNGIDLDRDIVKIAVLERHMNTGHKGVGLISGTGLKRGAIASSVSHDSHNIIVIGVNEEDMAFAAEQIRRMGGGCVVVDNEQIVTEMPLPIAGLMTDAPAEKIAVQNEALRESVHKLGVPSDRELFMTTAFVSLAVIPHLKITTKGLVDVDAYKIVPLFCD